MTIPPQNNLERSLMRAAQDPAHRPQFYRDLVGSDFFIVQQGPPPERSRRTVLQKGRQLEIQELELNGKFYLPVFSSLVRLQASLREEAAYIALNAMDFMELTQGAEFLLDPGSPFSKEFTTEEIRSIIDGSIWEPYESYTVEKDTEVIIGQPEKYPHDLVDALSRLFKKNERSQAGISVALLQPGKR